MTMSRSRVVASARPRLGCQFALLGHDHRTPVRRRAAVRCRDRARDRRRLATSGPAGQPVCRRPTESSSRPRPGRVKPGRPRPAARLPGRHPERRHRRPARGVPSHRQPADTASRRDLVQAPCDHAAAPRPERASPRPRRRARDTPPPRRVLAQHNRHALTARCAAHGLHGEALQGEHEQHVAVARAQVGRQPPQPARVQRAAGAHRDALPAAGRVGGPGSR